MTAAFLKHARSKLRFLVKDHGFEESNNRESNVERLLYHRDANEEFPALTICVGFGFESTPFLAFQLWRGNRAGRSFSVPECRTQAALPRVEEFNERKRGKSLDQAFRMWETGEFDEIFNAIVDEYARAIKDNIDDINRAEVKDVVDQLKQKKPRKK